MKVFEEEVNNLLNKGYKFYEIEGSGGCIQEYKQLIYPQMMNYKYQVNLILMPRSMSIEILKNWD